MTGSHLTMTIPSAEGLILLKRQGKAEQASMTERGKISEFSIYEQISFKFYHLQKEASDLPPSQRL